MHVLQVEDDLNLMRAVEEMLRGDGHQCDSTSSGERAVTLGMNPKYQIILLDLILPDIDGYEVMRQLREAGVRTPVVVQSGLLDRGRGSDALGFGVTDYLLKPFNKGELIDCMQAAISRSSRGEDAEANPKAALQIPTPICMPDRRRHQRFKSLKSVKVAYQSGLNCIIFNMSHGGAAMRLPENEVEVPQRFALKFRSGEVRHCEVRWRSGATLGIKFI